MIRSLRKQKKILLSLFSIGPRTTLVQLLLSMKPVIAFDNLVKIYKSCGAWEKAVKTLQ